MCRLAGKQKSVNVKSFILTNTQMHNYLACQRKVLYIHWSHMTSECLGPASEWPHPHREEKHNFQATVYPINDRSYKAAEHLKILTNFY